jgi:NADH-quinone oxidoreductase subunit C
MSDTNIIDKVKASFADAVIETHNFRGDQTVTVKKESLMEIIKFLRDDPDLVFNFLMDITAVDYLERKSVRFEVVYHLYSLQFNYRVRIKAPVGEEDCKIDTVAPLYKTANWYEREIWDMYGIKFNDHPNLTRILLYEGFKGHPLRKDYPINKRQPLIGPMN